MENSNRSLLEQANSLSTSAMAAGIASEQFVQEALECAEFLRYVISLVQTGKYDEALYHLRCNAAQQAPAENMQ